MKRTQEDPAAPSKPSPPEPTATPDELASLQLILAIGRSFKYVDDYVRPRTLKLGLTMTEFAVLDVLSHAGPTPLGELSHRILLTGASTTYTVKKLEARGLLVRRPLPTDQRVILGTITEKGRSLLEQIFPIHLKDLVHAMRALSTEEKRTVVRLLRKLRNESARDDREPTAG